MNSRQPVVFVIDDDPSVRKSLSRLLRAAELEVTACESAQQYLEQYDPDLPGCLVLDLAMPEVSGLDLQNALLERGGAPPIIFLTGRADIPDSVQAMKHGAIDFLTKPVDENTLIAAVRTALDRDRSDRQSRAELADIQARLATLTPREMEVLGYVIAGRLNKVIAYELGTVEKTIKVHRARVMQKMQTRSLAELVQLAARAGIAPKPGV